MAVRLPQTLPWDKWCFFDGAFRLNHEAFQSIARDSTVRSSSFASTQLKRAVFGSFLGIFTLSDLDAHLLRGNRDIFVTALGGSSRAASGRPEAVADDERGEEVRRASASLSSTPRRPALSGSHSPVSKKRGSSMTRCNCESTSQATKFSRTLATGSASAVILRGSRIGHEHRRSDSDG